MTNKKFFWAFSILAVIYWACSILGYRWYMDKVHSPGSSEYIFMLLPIIAGIIFIFVYLLTQAILLNNRQSRFSKTKVFLSFIGICYVCLAAYTVSLMRNPVHQRLFLDFLSGHVRYRLLDLARVLLDAEGLDLLFCFGLAVISGHLIYSKKVKFDIKGFFLVLSAWAIILSVKEVIKYYLPLRNADVWDAVKNMIGGVLPGLALSSRWFWRR